VLSWWGRILGASGGHGGGDEVDSSCRLSSEFQWVGKISFQWVEAKFEFDFLLFVYYVTCRRGGGSPEVFGDAVHVHGEEERAATYQSMIPRVVLEYLERYLRVCDECGARTWLSLKC
jgi:hypothetical protein